MAVDPQHGLSLSDWLQLILGTVLTAIVGGIGGAMAWFSKTKAIMMDRLEEVEKMNNVQSTDIAVLKMQQEHTNEQLSDIRETTRDTNRKVDDVLLAIKQGRP